MTVTNTETTPQFDTASPKLALMLRAAQIVATTDPLSITFRAAARVLQVKLDGQYDFVSGKDEKPEALQDLVAGLTEVVQADPLTAGQWVSALRAVHSAHAEILDVEKMKPNADQIDRARQFLGCDLGEIETVRFDEKGNLIARKIYESFLQIPEEISPVT